MEQANGHPEDHPVVIEVSKEEVANGSLSEVNLKAAVEAMHNEGLVVLNNVIPTEILDKLNVQMCKETEDLLSRPTTHFNFKGTGNVSQVPPTGVEWLKEEIYANPLSGQVLVHVLGPKPELRYLHGNTALKGEGRQPVHADLGFDHPRHVFAIVANVMLVDTNLENGATEVWLGTHRDTDIRDHESPNEGRISQARLEERRAVRPPIRPFIKKGSIILRDLRLWHAGISSKSDVPRCMLALVHFAAWYGNRLTVKLPESTRPLIEKLNKKALISWPAEFIPDERYDHLGLLFDANFSDQGGRPGAPALTD